jgi:BolA protein
MSVADRIRQKLEAALKPERLDIYNDSHLHAGHHHGIEGGETHFRLEIVSSGFIGQNRVARQRQVNGLLAEELAGTVHALQLMTLTPDEDTGRRDQPVGHKH